MQAQLGKNLANNATFGLGFVSQRKSLVTDQHSRQ